MTLAQGKRRAFVAVDERGEIIAIGRAVEGAKTKDVNATLSDIDKEELPRADDLRAERLPYDRDAQEAGQQDTMMEAAQDAAQAKVSAEDDERAAKFDAFQRRREELHKQVTDYREVFQRKAAERIQERRDYWQIDQLEKERAAAQKDLDDHSGWIYRYVFRFRHRQAQEQLDNVERNLEERRDSWAKDIVAIHDGKPDTLTVKALRQHGFEDEADLLSELVCARQQLHEKQLGDIDQARRDQHEAERAQIKEGVEAFRNREKVETPTPELARDFENSAPPPGPKLQRDMTSEELEALRDKLFEQMQAKLDEQYSDLSEDRDAIRPEPQADPRLDHDDEDMDEDKLQRDMSEAELEAAKESVRQRIAEASHGFEDDGVSKGGNDEPDIER
ncbi:MAG: hypothetical protein AAF354_10840 [Pseudomonadota bacterium]